MKDEIIAEVRRNRDALAAQYDHDLDAIVAAMQERERHPLTRLLKKRKPSRGTGGPPGPPRQRRPATPE